MKINTLFRIFQWLIAIFSLFFPLITIFILFFSKEQQNTKPTVPTNAADEEAPATPPAVLDFDKNENEGKSSKLYSFPFNHY